MTNTQINTKEQAVQDIEASGFVGIDYNNEDAE